MDMGTRFMRMMITSKKDENEKLVTSLGNCLVNLPFYVTERDEYIQLPSVINRWENRQLKLTHGFGK